MNRPTVRRAERSTPGSGESRPLVVFAASPDDGVVDELRHRTSATIEVHGGLDRSGMIDAVGRAQVLVTRSSQRIDRDLLARAGRRLAALVQPSSGVDNIDLDAARERGIEVVSVDPGNATSVAELCLLSLIAMARNARSHWQCTAAGSWADREAVRDRELRGRVLGIVGIGRVGSRVATRALAFEMRVLAYDPYVELDRFVKLGVTRVEDLDAMLPSLDALSMHCPLTAETRGMIDRSRLAAMRQGALLVNTARGAVVDEAALIDALNAGQIGAAALDVFSDEPPAAGAIVGHPAVLATPHIAGHTLESHQARRRNLVEALAAVIDRLADGTEHR